MNRILIGMAGVNYMLVAITIMLGLMSDPPRDAVTLGADAFRYHFPMGIFTALFSLLTHCMVFTYFLGTNRWVKETATAYRLAEDFNRKSRAYRTQAFVMALISMLLVVATVASGAGAHTRVWPLWIHQALPAGTYLFMIYAYRIEFGAIEAHIELTDAVMAAVNEMRRARGLPVD